MLSSYVEVGGINRLDEKNLPSKAVVSSICEQLMRLLFPGFFEDQSLTHDNVRSQTQERLVIVMLSVQEEIWRALRCSQKKESRCEERAKTLTHDFFSSLPKVRRLVSTDVEAAYEGDPAAASLEEIILSYPCIEAIAVQRMAHELYRVGVPLLPRMMTEWSHGRTGIDIHPGAQIGSHFFIDHGTGVVIGETCVIGHHVKVYHGVTLGAKSFAKDEEGRIKKGGQRHPRVDDYVVIYPNATVLGGDTVIGKNSTIGGNALITKSVPAYSLVATEEPTQQIFDKRQKKLSSTNANPSPSA
jgi:serine O-acetyltransferase